MLRRRNCRDFMGLMAIFLCAAGCGNTGISQVARMEAIPEPVPEASYGMAGDLALYPHGPSDRNLTDMYTDITQNSFGAAGGDFDPDICWSNPELMVFASTRHSLEPDIYFKSAFGTAVTRRTSHPCGDIHPAFSHNGKYIAFASNRSGNWDIWIMCRDNGYYEQMQPAWKQNDIHPTWSPDDEWIAWNSFNDRTGEWEIWKVNRRTTAPVYLGDGLAPKWSPDGKKIAYQQARDRGPRWYSIWIMNADDGREKTEVVASDDWAAINPAWSPDSKRLVFATVNKSLESKGNFFKGDDIWTVRLDGTGLVRLTTHPAADWAPVWAPEPDPAAGSAFLDEKGAPVNGRIYFCSERDKMTHIWSIRPKLLDDAKPVHVEAELPPASSAKSETLSGQKYFSPLAKKVLPAEERKKELAATVEPKPEPKTPAPIAPLAPAPEAKN